MSFGSSSSYHEPVREPFPIRLLASAATCLVKEFDLIARLKATLPTHDSVVAGAGDDCAVLDLGLPLAIANAKAKAEADLIKA